jgi:hypothetical protein
MQIATFIAGFVVYAWLLIIIHRQGVRKQMPWFASYVVWECVATLAQLLLWLVHRQLYYAAFWWIEAVDVALIVAAVRESFLRIFEGFTKIAGFRWSVWGVIGAVVAYSSWKAIHAPPLQISPFFTLVVGAEFLFRWGIAGIALLTTVLTLMFEGSVDTREDAVVTGFGIASIAFVLYVSTFSILGQKYIFITKYLPSVGYFLAAGWWIWLFSRPIEEFGFTELGMGPEEIRKRVRQYREHLEEMMRKKW